MPSYEEYLYEYEYLYDEAPARHRKARQHNRTKAEILAELVEEEEVYVEGDWNPTFSGSRHEREWILTYLGPFHTQGVITDVLHQVKGGKEANVYCCSAHATMGTPLLAAKVYRPRMFRNLRNDTQYRQGRIVLGEDRRLIKNRKLLNAMKNKTSYGMALVEMSWLGHEYETMQLLYEAGADVPRPFAQAENAILMEYVGEAGRPASTLNHVTLPREEAHPLFERLLVNIERMLANFRVHGDLSAYNVLYWQGEITIIDFPQSFDPYVNPDARLLFERDVTRICEYFARYGMQEDGASLATEIWNRHVRLPELEFDVEV